MARYQCGNEKCKNAEFIWSCCNPSCGRVILLKQLMGVTFLLFLCLIFIRSRARLFYGWRRLFLVDVTCLILRKYFDMRDCWCGSFPELIWQWMILQFYNRNFYRMLILPSHTVWVDSVLLEVQNLKNPDVVQLMKVDIFLQNLT